MSKTSIATHRKYRIAPSKLLIILPGNGNTMLSISFTTNKSIIQTKSTRLHKTSRAFTTFKEIHLISRAVITASNDGTICETI